MWGAIGFRNGGGNDDTARREAQSKFNDDLSRALRENPTLQGFVFFTNVDFTPSITDNLKSMAVGRGISHVDIFDMERLRHTLDSPEGLIARLQYLEIPMSATEQIGLVSKFGSQLQNAILSRFDRVERTLSEMERYLDFQTPLHRLDIFVSLNRSCSSASIGDEAVLVQLLGLHDLSKSTFFLCQNLPGHKSAQSNLVVQAHSWLRDTDDEVQSFMPSASNTPSLLAAYCELSLTTGGHRVRVADLSTIRLKVVATSGLSKIAKHIAIDANGYELFNCPTDESRPATTVNIPESISADWKSAAWFTAIGHSDRNLLFTPPRLSGRYSQLSKS